MFELMVEEHFCAAHYLKGYEGKCEKLHGHNWKVQLFITTDSLNNTGMVVDFNHLKNILKEILEKFDHFCLNDLEIFKDKNPTSENIAKILYKEISKKDIPGKISKVVVWESNFVNVAYNEK